MNSLENDVCNVVEDILITAKNVPNLKRPISAISTMENTSEWDSLSFVGIFMGVSEYFDIDVDEDDAISFTSVKGIIELILELKNS